MASKKYVVSLEIDGTATADGIIETGGGSPTTLFLTDGSTQEVDSWQTVDW
jgi:hypothetical protein